MSKFIDVLLSDDALIITKAIGTWHHGGKTKLQKKSGMTFFGG
jgi:hypothetical protein